MPIERLGKGRCKLASLDYTGAVVEASQLLKVLRVQIRRPEHTTLGRESKLTSGAPVKRRCCIRYGCFYAPLLIDTRLVSGWVNFGVSNGATRKTDDR